MAPENKNSFFSNIFISWLDPTIWKGYRHGPLTQDMLGSNPDKISVEASVEDFRRNWDRLYQEKVDKNSTEDVGLIWPLLQSFGWRFLWANMIAVVHYSIGFVSPQVTVTSVIHNLRNAFPLRNTKAIQEILKLLKIRIIFTFYILFTFFFFLHFVNSYNFI